MWGLGSLEVVVRKSKLFGLGGWKKLWFSCRNILNNVGGHGEAVSQYAAKL